jgi:hypothetical protein
MGFFDAQGIDTSKPQAQQNTTGTQTSSVSPWAQPYVNNYLTKSQDLLNQGVQPSALQNQSYIGAANLSMPGAFGAAEGLATQAGQGQLASAPIAYGYGTQGSEFGKQGSQLGIAGGALYGMQGAGYGAQAAGAGQNYANMATNPNSIQAYMNPYIQQSLAPQLSLLNQQQALQAQDINARASGQGAFGGNRATLAQGLNAQNFDLARQQAIGQGYNQAFNQAQQAQQFGANLGVQGLQAGMQGAGVGLQGVGTQLAGTGQGMQGAQVGLQGVSGAQAGYTGATNAANALTNIGTAQNNAAMGITGLQNQLGTQQYNLPYQQLQFGQGMLSGLPVSQQNTTGQQIGYQAAPNQSSQIAGLGTAALGGLGLLNQSGALSGIKSMFGGSNSPTDNTSYGINNNSPIAMPTDNTGISGNTAYDVSGNAIGGYGAGGEFASYANNAKGGVIRSYAKGGLVTLALHNALRGAV